MAYDEALADRIRDLLAPREAVTERKMFGGIGFMVGGNMACGVSSSTSDRPARPRGLREQALAEPGARAFNLTGRPMKGWILVEAGAVSDDEELAGWVDAGADYAASLPPK